ncbi:MAG: hypothetical protein QOF18_3028 [Frankiaceae bacterium]|nr:hypothetical protein [Frankiaceae bacterium]
MGPVEDGEVEQIVISDRTMGRVLALLPGLVVALAVRVLTLATPPLGIRVAAAGAVALACWTAFRLLTSKVTVGDLGVRVRGVLYDADIPWAHLESVDVSPSGRPLRLLVWGVMQPHTLRLRTGSRTLRPVAAITTVDDEGLERAIGAMRVRSGASGIPQQRQPQESVTSV